MYIPSTQFLNRIGLTAAALVVSFAAALSIAGGAYGAARQARTEHAAPSRQGGRSTTPQSAASGARAQKGAASSRSLATPKQKESYALGMNIARGLERDAVQLDMKALVRGIQDELSGKAQLSDDQAVAELKQLTAEVRAKHDQQVQKAAEENMKEGEAFLAANKTKEGVVALPSGLQYKIEKEGTGPKPTASDTVVCNYRGTFINGKEFDSSYKRGKPATFPVGGVIKGWTQALQMMPVGSKWELFIPPDLGYGPRGAGGVIGPNETLVFEVELLSIQGK